MKRTIITLLILITLSCSFGCIRQLTQHRDIINTILDYYQDYDVEVIDSDPNCVTITIRK